MKREFTLVILVGVFSNIFSSCSIQQRFYTPHKGNKGEDIEMRNYIQTSNFCLPNFHRVLCNTSLIVSNSKFYL